LSDVGLQKRLISFQNASAAAEQRQLFSRDTFDDYLQLFLNMIKGKTFIED